MSKFFEALQRQAAPPPRQAGSATPAIRPVKLQLVPMVQAVPAELSRDDALLHLAEQVSAMATVSESSRLFVAGCDPGDGTSSIAVALALDLSQRLGMPTALVDAHLQHPTLQNFFTRNDAPDSRAVAQTLRPSGLPRLDLMVNSLGDTAEELVERTKAELPRYRSAVVDLGVPRLDPSVLRIVQPEDLILIVARYGQTERRDLLATVRTFSAANHPAAGVIFNAVKNPIPNWLKRIVRIGG